MRESGELPINDLIILLVEDQVETMESVCDMLASFGATRVVRAQSGLEAKKILNQEDTTVNLILCDWNMDMGSGLELLQYLNKSKRKIPFVMMTGRNDVDSVTIAKREGVEDYIGKPFSIDSLQNKIMRIYESKLNFSRKLSALSPTGECTVQTNTTDTNSEPAAESA